MSNFTSLVKCIGSHISDPNLRREVEDEVLHHLETTALRLHARGLSLADANEQAMKQFGDSYEIGKELGRVHNGIKFRYFAGGGLLWYVVSAVIFQSHVIFEAANGSLPLPYWIVQLPSQVLGLPHWLALQSPQIHNMTILDPIARFMEQSFRISGWHVDAVLSGVILTCAAYGVYRLVRACRTSEGRQARSLLRTAFKS